MSTQSLSRVSLGALVLLFALGGAPASASETPEQQAEALAARAVTMARSGDLARAAQLFEAAYALDPAPILLYNVGRVKARLGDLAGARDALQRYLAAEPDPTARDRGREALGEVEAALAAAPPVPAPVPAPVPVETVLKRPAAPAPHADLPAAPEAAPPDRTWMWVGIGTGAAVLVAGGIVTAVLLSARSSRSSADGVMTIGKPLEALR